MKPNFKQAADKIKAIMNETGASYKEAQKRFWSNWNSNIGNKAAKLRKTKETEAEKAARAANRKSQTDFSRKCHTITGTTSDGLNIKIQLTKPVKKSAPRKTKTASQPGASY